MNQEILHKFKNIAYGLQGLKETIKQINILIENIEHMQTSLYNDIENMTGHTGKLSPEFEPLDKG